MASRLAREGRMGAISAKRPAADIGAQSAGALAETERTWTHLPGSAPVPHRAKPVPQSPVTGSPSGVGWSCLTGSTSPSLTRA